MIEFLRGAPVISFSHKANINFQISSLLNTTINHKLFIYGLF